MKNANGQLIERVEQFVRQRTPGGAEPENIEVRPLKGGLESAGVYSLECKLPGGKRERFVLKQLQGFQAREARVYESVLSAKDVDCCPTFFGAGASDQETLLLLEFIRPARSWPWREHGTSAGVMSTLARLHSTLCGSADLLPMMSDWNYEVELLQAIENLIEFIEANKHSEYVRPGFRSLRRLKQMRDELPAIRRQLLEFQPFAPCVIHGDVHPGNLLLRKSRGREIPVFIDWGRFRIGSALEDVSSWLQSLGYWEPEARRRHDTLLGAYLVARGQPGTLGRDLRDAYWLAAACNILAGATLYHLMVANAEDLPLAKRGAAAKAAADCLRIVRRANACWTA